ncbi:response regulator [Radiobacillus kanasensis]|uniref:response regulator transcription factor n=1 Tax=Radiobacillus kanasensis TaxID=2844358 RepID=UPI001E4283E0|nr:response regulator [Radiobacillus kanasensis]UFT98842.1 response regulator [Radiobacillus kanasensis]
MKKVLLIEDEEVIRQGVRTLLEEVIMGYKVLWESSNGEKALEIVNIEVPDLIITDIRMPRMNGIEFISLLKGKYPHLPVIIISGHDDFIYVKEALKLGVKDYLLKPIDRRELASTLDAIWQDKEKSYNTEGYDHIRQITDIIETHLEEDLSLSFIANLLNLHPNYISQLFKQGTNTNLSEYILNKRIEKSKELLKETNLKIYDISHLVGYSNAKHFASLFKKQIGKTPQQFRKGL